MIFAAGGGSGVVNRKSMAMVACRVLSVVLLLGLYSTSSVTGNNSTASDTVNTLYTSYRKQLLLTLGAHAQRGLQ